MIISLLYNLLPFLFIFYAIRTIFFHIFLWQLKEYRLDRIKSHLATVQGKKILFNYFNTVKWIYLLIYLLFYFFIKQDFLIIFLFFLYSLEFCKTLYQIFSRTFKMPSITLRSIFILFITIFIIVSISFFPWDYSFHIPLLDRLLWIFIFTIVVLTNIPSIVHKYILKFIAVNKIRKYNQLKIIGITGSYGKTSTKEFIYQLLKPHFLVAKTDKSHNTVIGVCKDIIKNLKSNTKYMIIEMGAYKKGEISEIARLFKPHISVITGVNIQHLELFKTFENIKQAKFELIQKTLQDGEVILNLSQPNMKFFYEETRKSRKDLRITAISVKNNIKTTNPIRFISVTQRIDGLDFKVNIKNKTYIIKTSLLGKQNVENLLLALAVCLKTGLEIKKIITTFQSLKAVDKTMKYVEKFGNLTLVDDTFNVNPLGVEAAVSYMQNFNSIKILVLTPMIELGSQADMTHQKVGQYMSDKIDYIFLTNSNYAEEIKKGISQTKSTVKADVIISDPDLFYKLISENRNKIGVVVFEGKEAQRYLDRLIK